VEGEIFYRVIPYYEFEKRSSIIKLHMHEK